MYTDTINCTISPHYRTRLLCRVPETLGKCRKTLGKEVAECYRRSRLCRVPFLGHSANLCRVPSRTRQKKLKRDGRTGKLANGTGERDERDGRTGKPLPPAPSHPPLASTTCLTSSRSPKPSSPTPPRPLCCIGPLRSLLPSTTSPVQGAQKTHLAAAWHFDSINCNE